MLQEWSEPLASPGPVQVSFAYGGFGGLLFLGTMAAWMGFYMLHPFLPHDKQPPPRTDFGGMERGLRRNRVKHFIPALLQQFS